MRNERIATIPRRQVTQSCATAVRWRLAQRMRTQLDIPAFRWHQNHSILEPASRMKLFFLKLFTWWNGQTFGTQLWTWRFGELVGKDEQGNLYYRTKGRKIDPSLGFERRWVIYNGYAEATPRPAVLARLAASHRRRRRRPKKDYTPREWEKPHVPNMTGTPAAYRPSGSTLASGRRPQGDRRLPALDARQLSFR